MLRRLLLAALLCAFAATSALTMRQTTDVHAPVATEDCDRDSTSDGRWNAAPRHSAAITESMWKLPLVHADLAGARCFDLFAAIRAASPPDRPVRPAPIRPLRIPLLI